MKKTLIRWAILLLLPVILLSGCGLAGTSGAMDASLNEAGGVRAAHPEQTLTLEDEPLPLAAAIPAGLQTSASGKLVKDSGKAVIDYSNTRDGYVMVKYTASTKQRLKVLVTGPRTKYNYNLTAGKWETFPLSDGSGTYTIAVYENVRDTKYAEAVSVSANVTLADEFAPFLRSNQYVNYAEAPNTVSKAAELTAGKTAVLDKVQTIYDFVVQNLTYDKQLAASVQSGYLPALDSVLARKSGICFDYAALMAGMLRSQSVPCKLVVGYAGTAYHAWISVWTRETGWIEGVVYFDGTNWQRMDPTFASSAKQSESINQFIGDGKNYTEKYLY